MKKILLLLTTLIILIPLNLKASDITAKLTGPKEVTIGETLTVKYTINIPNVGISDTYFKGIYEIQYDIDYDKKLLSLKSVDTNNYETAFINQEGSIWIDSEPKIKDCLENMFYCGSGTYTATLKFDILSKDATTASIKITDPIVIIGDFNDALEFIENNITIEELEEKMIKESPNNFETLIFTIKKPQEADTRSSNNNLSSLEIQNYKIDFNKETQEYEINVANNVNKIVVKATPEDTNSRVKITGDDDLESNNNQVTIEVIAENESIKTYTIKVNHKEDVNEIIDTPKEETKTKITLDKKIIKLFGIIGGVLLLLIILFSIKSIIKKKKINEMFEEL